MRGRSVDPRQRNEQCIEFWVVGRVNRTGPAASATDRGPHNPLTQIDGEYSLVGRAFGSASSGRGSETVEPGVERLR
jgi:hypothetical protein